MMEIRTNDDGSLDEIIGDGPFHLVQRDDGEWFLSLGGVTMMLRSKGKIEVEWNGDW